ncbi:hypothetical protein FRC10_010776 [Ceratobasidium sp. 414]|nr:hypothetical protein FRC10_010776 [Ceratobasidium sp. 414]
MFSLGRKAFPALTLWTLDGPPEDGASDAEASPVSPKPPSGGERESEADSDRDEFYDTPMNEFDETASQAYTSKTSLPNDTPPELPPKPSMIVRNILAGEHYTSTFPGTSQYARGGSSACGLASMNAIRLAFDFCSNIGDGEALISALISQDYVKNAMEIATHWPNEMHLEVEPILELPLFARSLRVTDVQYRGVRFRTFSDALFALQSSEGPPGPRAVFLTRPPEMIAVMHIPIPMPPNNTSRPKSFYLIFDSHPRPDHPDGTAVQIFPSHPTNTIADYLADLFQIDAALINDPTLEWHVQLLGQISCHFLAPAISGPQNEYAMNMTLLELKQQLSEAKRKLAVEEKEKRQSQTLVFNLQQEVALLNNTERKHQKEIRQLKDQLKGAADRPQARDSDWNWGHPGKRDPKGKGRESQGTRTSSTHGYGGKSNSFLDDDDLPKYQPRTRSNFSISSRARTLPTVTPGPSDSRTLDDNAEDADMKRSFEVALAMQQEFDRERVALLEDQTFALAVERPKFDCGICLDSFTDEAIAFVDECDHSCCRECMRSHVQSKIEERRYPIPCPFCVAGSDDKSGVKATGGVMLRKEPTVISSMLVETIGVTPELFNTYTELQMAEHSIMIDCRGCLCILTTL